MAPVNVVKVKPAIETSILHLYKELEVGHVSDKYSSYQRANFRKKMTIEKNGVEKNGSNLCSQLASFQHSTRWLIILGQAVGLMPVHGVLQEPPAPMRTFSKDFDNFSHLGSLTFYSRFKIVSPKIVYGLLMFISQALIAAVTFLRMFQSNVSVHSVGNFSFYVTSAVTTIIFFQVAKKWPALVKKLPHFQLDEYIDPKIKKKCNLFVTFFFTLAIVEHLLSVCSGVAVVLDCAADYTRLYREYIELSFPWVAEFGLPDHFLLGFYIQFINITATITWNYSDIFIVCISYYLTSILEGINRKLNDKKTKYLSSSFWISIREDYNHAAQLVRAIDEVISSVLFASFAINLFFICFQLYNLLSDGMRHKTSSIECPRTGSGPLRGYEKVIYLTYSMVFVLFRYLCVSLIAARVNTTAQSLAPTLYCVPSTVYNVEVQRLLDQVHHDTVALSGLQFFYVTKSLVLTVAGSIFTYELVLLQYGE